MMKAYIKSTTHRYLNDNSENTRQQVKVSDAA